MSNIRSQTLQSLKQTARRGKSQLGTSLSSGMHGQEPKAVFHILQRPGLFFRQFS
jgi:hypothetical protein